MCISKNITNLEILNLNGQSLRDCREVEILVITLDRNWNFKSQLKRLCRKVGQKLSALLRVTSYIHTNKKALLYKSVVKQISSYTILQPVSLPKDNQIKWESLQTHLQVNSNFEILLEKEHVGSKNWNLQISKWCCLPRMKSLFQFLLNQYNLINFQELSIEKRSKVNYGLQKLKYRAPAIWAKLLSMFLKPRQMKLN